MDTPQDCLFELEPSWKDLWKGMPDFHQDDMTPYQSVTVHFRNEKDRKEFAELIAQKITDETKSIWYPKALKNDFSVMRYDSNLKMNPRHPVYIISKGRWETRLTSKALEKLNVPYSIVVEPQEFDQYAAVIDPKKILTLPFSNLGQGSIPARNWVWEHSISIGAKRHWILDDNIAGFCRLNENKKVPVDTGVIFCAAEDFSDRYTNVGLSGMNYRFFAVASDPRKQPFTLNTRIYSCILIRNDLPFRWRGRYNEDTDLSIRVLKSGQCTVLFNAFLADKMATMTMKGGNTDELYVDDGRLKMAQSLQEQHPDIVEIVDKWGRPQHHVNYRIFRTNKLQLDPNIVIPSEPNNYGMKLKE